MQVLLHADMIQIYLARQKNEAWYLIRRVLKNEKSKIVLTKKLLECWENTVGVEYFDAIQALLMEWQGEQHLQYATTASETKTCDQEFEHLAQNTTDLLLPFAIAETPNLKTIKNISFLEKINKPNKHWLLFEIAANHPNKASLSHFDCTVVAQIQSVFDTIFKINLPNRTRRTNSIQRVIIFDRLQSDSIRHTYFKELGTNNTDYYTIFGRNRNHAIERKTNIKEVLGRITKVFTATPSKTHSRKIIAENFIIFVDDDFNSLDIAVGNWTIDIQYCPLEAQKWRNDCTDYTEFT